MRAPKTALGASAATIAVLGCCGIALAQTPQTHTLTITLPGGGVEQIQYTGGAVAPQVYLSDAPAPIFTAMPPMFGANSPFAELDRISAEMDRQANQMLREAAALSAGSAQPNLTAVSSMPAGGREYSFVSTMNGNNVCSRSVEITSEGNGAAPRVVTHTSGNCNGVAAPEFQVPAQLPTAPAINKGPRMIMTKATGTHPDARPRVIMAKTPGVTPARVEEASLN